MRTPARPLVPRRRCFLQGIVAGCVLALVSLTIAAESATIKFNVPAGDAENSLKIFSEQARLHVLFPTEAVTGERTRAVIGEYAPSEALALMLTGTNLIARQDEKTGVLTVRRNAPAPGVRKNTAAEGNGERSRAVDVNETIELSPFTVTSDKDVGYLAANSLSGSRMDMKLKDTAASISVMTEEFLKDLGATSLTEALVYSNNAIVDFGEAGEFGSQQEPNARIEFEQRYRVRGLPATVGRNYFKWTIPTDTFNVGRVEESRGPNAILFGVGSAGGIINISTKQAQIGRAIRAVTLAFGTHDSRRVAIDFNQPLLNGKGAVRFNAVWDKSNTFRHHAYSENRRGHLAAKYRPTSKTQIRFEFEEGVVDADIPRTGGLSDRSLPWMAAGRPTFSTTAPTAEFSAYGARLAVNQLRYISNSDRLINMAGQILTNVAGEAVEIFDQSIAHPSINTGGPGQDRSNRFNTYSIHLEQQLARKTYAELAFNHQYYRFYSYDPINSNLFYGDPNQTLPGTLGPNPFAGRSLLETNWRFFQRRENADTVRASISHELDAGKWGVYRGAVLADYQKNRYRNRNTFETWAGTPFNPTPENGANLVIRRSYVTTNDWASYYVNGPAMTGLIDNMVDPITGRRLSSTWIGGTGTNDDLTATRSVLAGLQASYFNGRLVAGAGYRYDRLDIRDRGVSRNPTTQLFEVNYESVNFIKSSGETTTFGVVGHVSKQVSVLYNQSRNIDIPVSNIRVLPDVGVGTPPKGAGQDYGVALDLFDGRLYARGVRFTTDYKGEIGFGGNPVLTANNNILSALRAAGLVSQADVDARDLTGLNGRTRDKKTDGYEFSLTANPTSSWRLQANFSITNGVEENIVPEVVAWWTVNRAYFERFPQNTPTGVGVSTVGSTIADFQNTLNDWKSTEGIGLVGNRKYKTNFFARYAFSSGWIKGVFVGGGYRYQSKMLVARLSTGALQFAPPYGEASLLAGRNFRFQNRRELRLQLNITNLFDEKEPIIVRYRSTGNTTQPRQVILRSPLTWRLTTDYTF